MKITVIKKDIEIGIPSDDSSCPIARAMERQGVKDIRVLETKVEFCVRNTFHEVELPIRAIKFIRRFDADKPVKPFSFTLPL